MTSSRRLRWSLLAVVAATAAVTALLGLPAPKAQAFLVQYHDSITRNALPADQVSPAAMAQILVGPPPGGGAVGSDGFVADDFRHIDNAANPVEICARAQQAWDTFMPVVLEGAQPSSPGGTLVDGPRARAAFGALAHAQQDFYSHSNWVEENIAVGQLERLAPPIFPTCDPAAFPAGLHTGFFELAFGNPEDALGGCPPEGPPPPFQDCHSTLNKDSPTSQRGSQPVPGSNMTMFDLASQLATDATTALYVQVRELVVSKYGEPAAVALFQAEGSPVFAVPADIPTTVPGLGP